MAWNEPGGGKQDPWGNRGNDQGPPDLDEVVRKLQDKLGGIFGGGKGGNGSATTAPGGAGIGVLILLAVIVWLAYDSLYIIQPAERGVVTRLGAYTQTLQPGPNLVGPRPIWRLERVNVDEVRNIEVGYRSEGRSQSGRVDRESLMLTQDENIVDIKLAVQYKVKDASEYLFNLQNPDMTLHEITESALREVVGKNKMDFVLTEGRREIAERVNEVLQEVLDFYKSGLLVTSVNLQDAQPPEQVQHAFADAVKAREDEQRFKNEAEAYANDIIPKARGAAARQMEEANAYKSKVTAEAEGAASRFSQVLTEYKRAPKVTRERLYIDAVQTVLTNTSKVMVSVEQGNSLIYLPLDRFVKESGSMSNFTTPQQMAPAINQDSAAKQEQNVRDTFRNRGER